MNVALKFEKEESVLVDWAICEFADGFEPQEKNKNPIEKIKISFFIDTFSANVNYFIKPTAQVLTS